MAFPSVTYTFTNGSTADATQVNQNFTDLINGLSDGTKSLSISAITAASTATLSGNVSLGLSSSNTLTVNASVAATILVNANGSYDLGGSTLGFRSLYLGGTGNFTTRILGATLAASWTLTLPTSAGTSRQRLETDGSGVSSWQPIRRTGSDAQNIAISATVAANALTIALKTLINNGDPSSTDPIDVVFRNATVTTGQPVVRTITGALSIVVPDATTLGLTISQVSYLFVYLIDNAGTPELAVSPSGYWDEEEVITTIAVSGGSSLTSVYSTTARTSVALRLIGRIEIALGASSHWSGSPTKIATLPIVRPKQSLTGASQSTQGTSTSASPATLSNTPTVTITAARTGLYRVSCSPIVGYGSTSGINIYFQVAATSGTPVSVVNAICFATTTTNYANGSGTMMGAPFLLCVLTAGTAYTFSVQGSTSSGTVTSRWDVAPGYLTVTEEA